jgi:hypothetical protein
MDPPSIGGQANYVSLRQLQQALRLLLRGGHCKREMTKRFARNKVAILTFILCKIWNAFWQSIPFLPAIPFAFMRLAFNTG